MKNKKISKKESPKSQVKNITKKTKQIVTYPSYTDTGDYIVDDQYIRVISK